MLVRVFNFDMYRSVRAVRISPRGYWYVDRPLPGDSSVLISTEAHRLVPSRISIVTEAFRSVCFGMVGEGVFKVLECTDGTYRYVPYRAELGMPIRIDIQNLGACLVVVLVKFILPTGWF